jgi:hypothetical protein
MDVGDSQDVDAPDRVSREHGTEGWSAHLTMLPGSTIRLHRLPLPYCGFADRSAFRMARGQGFVHGRVRNVTIIALEAFRTPGRCAGPALLRWRADGAGPRRRLGGRRCRDRVAGGERPAIICRNFLKAYRASANSGPQTPPPSARRRRVLLDGHHQTASEPPVSHRTGGLPAFAADGSRLRPGRPSAAAPGAEETGCADRRRPAPVPRPDSSSVPAGRNGPYVPHRNPPPMPTAHLPSRWRSSPRNGEPPHVHASISGPSLTETTPLTADAATAAVLEAGMGRMTGTVRARRRLRRSRRRRPGRRRRGGDRRRARRRFGVRHGRGRGARGGGGAGRGGELVVA